MRETELRCESTCWTRLWHTGIKQDQSCPLANSHFLRCQVWCVSLEVRGTFLVSLCCTFLVSLCCLQWGREGKAPRVSCFALFTQFLDQNNNIIMWAILSGREGSAAKPPPDIHLMNLVQIILYSSRLWICPWLGLGSALCPCSAWAQRRTPSPNSVFTSNSAAAFGNGWGCFAQQHLHSHLFPLQQPLGCVLCPASPNSSPSPSSQSLSFEPSFRSKWKSSSSKMPPVNGFC